MRCCIVTLFREPQYAPVASCVHHHGSSALSHLASDVSRPLPPDTPDRLVDTALAVCGNDTNNMFTNGLELIIRGSSSC